MMARRAEDDRSRMTLDEVLERLADPRFASRFRRAPTMRSASDHVNPLMLAVSDRQSLYVRSWRPHVRHCHGCRELFRYFGLES